MIGVTKTDSKNDTPFFVGQKSGTVEETAD
jgi:hypothetical protein